MNPVYCADNGIGQIQLDGSHNPLFRLEEPLAPYGTANGIRFSSDEKMFMADYTGHNVLKYDPETGEVSVHAHSEKFNQVLGLRVFFLISYNAELFSFFHNS